jgi:hypothetical protein
MFCHRGGERCERWKIPVRMEIFQKTCNQSISMTIGFGPKEYESVRIQHENI